MLFYYFFYETLTHLRLCNFKNQSFQLRYITIFFYSVILFMVVFQKVIFPSFFFFTFYPFNPLLESANAGTSYYFIFRGRTVIVSLFYTLKLFSASNESNIFYLFYYYSSRVQCQICLVCKIKSIKYICFVISQYFITITFKTQAVGVNCVMFILGFIPFLLSLNTPQCFLSLALYSLHKLFLSVYWSL